MGVDLQTYRAKIGTYRHSCGTDVVSVTLFINFSQGLKNVGSVLFIGLLLIMAGVEQNPGPKKFAQSLPTVPTNPTKIRVKGLPVGISSEFLTMIFENEKRQGGGKVKEVDIDFETNTAIVEFEEPGAVELVIQKQPITVLSKEVQIEVLVDKIDYSTKIRVSGLPQNVDEEILAIFFEKEDKENSSKVEDVVIDAEGRYAIVEFEDAAAAKRIMEKRNIDFFGTTIYVEEFCMNSKTDQEPPKNTRKSTKLRVTDLPDGIKREMLIMFFENEKRQGGGKVKEVDIDCVTNTAVVEFEESVAVEVVMQKQPVKILQKEVHIEVINENKPVVQISPIIKVSDLPKEATEESLQMFFENEKRYGGGIVETVNINEDKRFALITFKEEDAVATVLNKRPIIFHGHEVKVEKFVPSLQSSSELEPAKLSVTALPEHVTEEALIMFFENEKRQGGGRVIDVAIDAENRSAVIKFENAKAVDKVLQKRPIFISGKEVTVNKYDQKHLNTNENRKIVVIGLPEDISTEYLTMFFENEKRYGGGAVNHVEISADKKSAVIEFSEADAVETVLRKRPVLIQAKEVEVTKYAPVRTKDTAKTSRIRVSGLPKQITEEFLIMFFENEKRQGGGKVKSVKVDKEKLCAVVEFEEAEAIPKILQKAPIVLSGQEVAINIIDEHEDSKEILVTGLPHDDISEEFLVMFFENENRQGGGPVKIVEVNKFRRQAIVEFEAYESVKRVLEKRPINIQGKECCISVFDGGNTVEVRGFESDQLPKLLQYFENPSLSGQNGVTNIRINRQKTIALVTFKSYEVVKRVLEQCRSERVLNVQTFIQPRNVEDFEVVYTRGKGFRGILPLPGDSGRQLNISKFEFGGGNEKNRYSKETNDIEDIFEPTRVNVTPKQEDNQVKGFQSHPPLQSDSGNKWNMKRFELESNENNGHSKETHKDMFEPLCVDETPKQENNEVKDSIEFYQILEKLSLTERYPSKISVNDVIAVSPREAVERDQKKIEVADIPWVMLRQFICAHSEARDITSHNNEENDTDFDSKEYLLSETSEHTDDLSPLDIFTVVFQCCDLLLKKLIFQKLYLCKMAVPFLYQSWNGNVLNNVISVWPLRYLAIENRDISKESSVNDKEVDVLEFHSKVIAFARFGRPSYSKSILLNSLLTSHGCKTFFNNDCPSGNTQRHLSNGMVEMFWLPTVGDKRDRFQHAMTFLNMRGDLNRHFTTDIYSMISKFADALAIIIDLSFIQNQSREVKSVLSHFSSVILIVASPLNPEGIQLIQNFQEDVKASRKELSLRVVSTHRGTKKLNVVDMVTSLSKLINIQLKSNTMKSIQQRLSKSMNKAIKSDEEEPDCHHGKEYADTLVKLMKSEGKPEIWKEAVTPVHCKYSVELGKLKKRREREKDVTQGENIDCKMTTIRNNQMKVITKTVMQFIDMLLKNSSSVIRIELILGWLRFHIEREKRKILPKLIQENAIAWEKLKTLKNNKETKPEDIDSQENVIASLESEIDNASFSVEHFFREIGHIYEAIIELKLDSSKYGLPPVSMIAEVVGRLVLEGHQLELVDGESFYMPFNWTQTVLRHVNNYINSSKVMTLSVLGLQSSGKSTLLNTMFGSQFSTRTGRCTRGIHIQLVPARVNSDESTKSPFSYVLVVDTEGLRSPELAHVQHEHDNELATVITGLGDITMLNIMGENTNEIKDILQVIVHAFLRLQMTNRKLDMRKCCTFIHQNVADTAASGNMKTGLNKLLQTLDEMTEESAKSEGILDITTFNQVIEFDINSHVWYLKNLWQGNPPMARVNTEYSERVVDMKCKTLQRALNMENKSYKAVMDILEHAHNLWKGVLSENFVFSFRNSLEIRAYIEMEMVVQDHLWQLQTFTREQLVNRSHSQFADCGQEILRNVADRVISELLDLLTAKKETTIKAIDSYFERNKYKDIIIQWKTTQLVRVDSLCRKLDRTIREQVEKIYLKRSLEILTISSHKKHEEELRKKSMEVANSYKGQHLSQKQIDDLFKEIWDTFLQKIDITSYSYAHKKDMKTVFIDILKNTFEKDSSILRTYLEKSNELTPIPKLDRLAGSFDLTGYAEEDISLSMFQKGKELFKISNVTKHIAERVNGIFVGVDESIDDLCGINEEITDMHVIQLLHDLGKNIEESLTKRKNWGFKPPFFIKMYIHVSRHTHAIFEKHNDEFLRTQGVIVRLEQYRQQQKISFEAHLNSRKSEDIIAQLLSNVVEAFAKEWTLAKISDKLTDVLHGHLPVVKNRVIIEICSDFLESKDFAAFTSYLLAPRNYARHWIRNQANKHMFGGRDGKYYSSADALIKEVFEKAEKCLEHLKKKFAKSSPEVSEWVDDFIRFSKEVQLSVPVESFRNVREEGKVVENVEYLTDAIKANMLQSKENAIREFRAVNKHNVKWTGNDPVYIITKKIWGCLEDCPFCGEPCAKNEEHEGDGHHCIQHRPTCCIGIREEFSNEGPITTCNFNINSNKTHTCGVFGFACNKGENENCSAGIHRCSEYKKFLPTWDITASANMHDSSKFWMWFVATFQNDLCKLFDYKLNNIPSSWMQISTNEARESLHKTYSAKK